MKKTQQFLLACAIASLGGTAVGDDADATADSHAAPEHHASGKRGCSLRDVVGKWLFATAIGRQMLPGLPPDKDMTALGTQVIKPDGSLSGTFDLTVEDTFFAPGIRYEGSIVINSDCTGTVTFVTEIGAARTDSIAVVGHGEMLGMSQDPSNLWTYQSRRVGHYSHKRD